MFTTTVTEAEILYGLRLLLDGRRRRDLEAVIVPIFREDFAGRILPFDSEAANAYAKLAAERRKPGRPISQFDAQIAAIARSRGAAWRRAMSRTSKVPALPSSVLGTTSSRDFEMPIEGARLPAGSVGRSRTQHFDVEMIAARFHVGFLDRGDFIVAQRHGCFVVTAPSAALGAAAVHRRPRAQGAMHLIGHIPYCQDGP